MAYLIPLPISILAPMAKDIVNQMNGKELKMAMSRNEDVTTVKRYTEDDFLVNSKCDVSEGGHASIRIHMALGRTIAGIIQIDFSPL